MAILQKTASAIGVLADGPIQRPRDLDGKTYAGFGYPNEVPTLKAVIQADGGTGDFTVATLDAAAYEALYNKQADFTIPFTAWEGVEAEQRGIGLRYFQFADYGFPEFYQVVLACDRQWLEREPGRRPPVPRGHGPRLRARGIGSGRGRRHPRRREPGRLRRQPGPAAGDSQRFLADGDFLVDASGKRRPPDAGAVAGLLGLPVRAGPPRGRGRRAAERAARLRDAVHERLPAVTRGREPR